MQGSRSFQRRCLGAGIGALIGALLGVIGGAEMSEILLWGALLGAVVGFVGGALLDLYGSLL